MFTPLLLLLQVAPATVSLDSTIPLQPGPASPLVRLESLRAETLQAIQQLREARSSMRCCADQPRSMLQDPDFTFLMDAIDEYVDYYVAYHTVQDAVVGAIEHAFYIDTPSCGETTEDLVLAMGGSYVAGTTLLMATYPDLSGQSTLTGTSGGIAFAQELALLPMSFSAPAQGGAPDFNHPVHYYSATQTDGSLHSGLAVQLDDDVTQPSLALYPDAVIGTSIFSPSELAVLRWVLLEDDAVMADVTFDFVLGPFAPPESDPSGPGGGMSLQQDWTAIYLCIWNALLQWKTDTTSSALWLQAWEKQIAKTYEPQYEALTKEVKDALGSHGVNVVMNDSFVLDRNGMSEADFNAKLQELRGKKNDIDTPKKTEEANLKIAWQNLIDLRNGQLHARVLDCLDGWPFAQEVADRAVEKAFGLMFP